MLAAWQQGAADTTFNAVFGNNRETFYGGGLDVLIGRHLFVDVTASRFARDGHRAFVSGGKAFDLGQPLTVRETPFEVSAGYRFGSGTVRPYAGGGLGSYAYTETSSSDVAGEGIDTRHVGVQLLGGVEVRVHRWVGVSVDGTWTRVPGILGTGGLSKDAGEDNLGGVAARLRVIVGR